MKSTHYSSVDPSTGNVTWDGPLFLQKGNHSHMPSRTAAYQSSDIRFHVNASSLGGANNRSNVVAGHNDIDKGAWASVEKGERTALQNGATIESEKTAVVNSQPGNRPSIFTVNDSVTYLDGHTESIYHSFTNASYAEQQTWNDQSAALPGTFDAPNPGDMLGSSMSGSQYAELMENTDAELPGIAEDYAAADFSGVPGASFVSSISENAVTDEGIVDSVVDADVSTSVDSNADCGVDEEV